VSHRICLLQLLKCAIETDGFGFLLISAGLFIFAWTAVPVHIHWIGPIIGAVPFGCGMVLVFLGVLGYLVDAYLVFAASVLAGNTVVRSIFGVGESLVASKER
jgi:hypothetical protein